VKSVKRWPWLVVLICAPEILLPLILGGAGFTLFSRTAVMGATLVLFGVGLGAKLLWQRHTSSIHGLGHGTHHEAANR
jgi:hypothetical protein